MNDRASLPVKHTIYIIWFCLHISLHLIVVDVIIKYAFTKLLFFISLQATPKDGLPPIVCIKCRDQLDSCHRFHRVAHQTHQALTDYLQFTSNLNGTPQVSLLYFLSGRQNVLPKLCFMAHIYNRWFQRASDQKNLNESFLLIEIWSQENFSFPIERFMRALCKPLFKHSLIYYAIQLWQVLLQRTQSANTPEYVGWHLNTATQRSETRTRQRNY